MQKNLPVEIFVLKQKQIDYGNGDVGIGQIEDRPEEVVVAVDQKAQDARHAVPLEERKVEHVDHLAHHESGVVAAQVCDRRGGRFREDQPVEGAVEDVAQRSGDDERQPDEDTRRGFAPLVAQQVADQPAQPDDHRDAKEPQQQLAPVESARCGDVHAEGGAVVLDEAQLEPVGKDDDRLVEVHVGLDPDLERLVRNEQQQDEQGYFLQIHLLPMIMAQK